MSPARKRRSVRPIGLALGAGGVRGIAHIGVLKVLERHHIPVGAIAGSSVGALIGALFAAWKDARRIERALYRYGNVRSLLTLLDPSWKGGLLAGRKIGSL